MIYQEKEYAWLQPGDIIEITKEHMQNGTQKNCECCALSLAFKDVLNEKFTLLAGDIECHIGSHRIHIGLYPQHRLMTYFNLETPQNIAIGKQVRGFLKSFDHATESSKNLLKPFSIKIETKELDGDMFLVAKRY